MLRWKPCSWIWRAVSHKEEHFTLSTLCVRWRTGSKYHYNYWVFKCCSLFRWISVLMAWREGMWNCSDCWRIKSAKGPLILWEELNWSHIDAGFSKLRPPKWHGKENNWHSSWEHGARPVRKWIKITDGWHHPRVEKELSMHNVIPPVNHPMNKSRIGMDGPYQCLTNE